MNCLDCTINERPATPAVGIYLNCGAAVCAGCAHLEERPAPQPATVGNRVAARPGRCPVRLVTRSWITTTGVAPVPVMPQSSELVRART